MDTPLTAIPWNEDGTEELRVSINDYKGKDYFAVRVWFTGRDGTTMFPGKSGINVAMDKLPEFIDAINKGHGRLQELQRIKAEHSDAHGAKDRKRKRPISDARD